MDVKYGKTKIVAMYICITANGPIENLYKNLRERDSIDSRIGKGDIIRIFEKGNKQDFNNRIFDIEFNKETTLEQAEKSWENEINKYSTIENIDDITDQLDIKNNQLKNSDTESEYSSMSGYVTDDSENTKEQKRKNKTEGKKPKYKNQFKLSQQEQFNIDKDIQFEIDQQQFQIQQNYQKDLNKQQTIETDDFDYTEDVELDIADEEFYEKFARENKYNNNYSGFKRMFKRL
ncbi:hypothetical protein C2G38_2197320 [Gigaspora rosea]|uniref:Uncharacterized protein n=1 Tax=Gigaspora rosea TaxID=44941 RepID=A0A397UVJ0_9GLOM|nr:hypothetical protein C2G38_2197320 [Gigaspora rosea]